MNLTKIGKLADKQKKIQDFTVSGHYNEVQQGGYFIKK